METNCTKCGLHLVAQWSFCPHCGTTIQHEHHEPEQRHVPARGAFGGLLYGVIAAPILIIAGVMICLTGWGLFIGVPIIAMGVLAPLAGPIFGMGEHKGKCPACGTTVISVPDGRVHACPTCSAQFAVQDREVRHAG